MIVKAKYYGFFPLGDDITINDIHIMQKEWHTIPHIHIVIGSKRIHKRERVSVFGENIFFVKENGRILFFAAIEYGLGKYHIFLFSDKVNKKLSKKANGTTVIHNVAVIINKIAQSVKIYGKFISPRDMNADVADSIYILLNDDLTNDCYTAVFTNNGSDRFRLIVKKPSGSERSENCVIIGKTELVRWEGDYYEGNEIKPLVYEFSVENNLVKCKERIGSKESEYIINIA